MISPQIDAEFARLALDFLENGNPKLLPKIAKTGAARHIATHAQRVSLSGDAPNSSKLVEQILTSASVANVDPEETRARLLLIETDQKTQLCCWREATAYLPKDALADVTLFLTVGYDIGVAVSGNASLNLAHPHFVRKPEELWFYCVHEIHHAGFQKYSDLPWLVDIKTTSNLVDLIKYLTTMEGLAVHAARRWRAEVGALESDSDYIALLDSRRMDIYEREFFTLLHDLTAARPRLLEKSDWEILERMSTGDRLWYRVGARMAYRIEKSLGRDVLVETIVEGPRAFFDRYMKLATRGTRQI